jgi:hypothetical protein
MEIHLITSQDYTERAGMRVTNLARILEVLGSSFGRITGYTDRGFL